MKEFRKTNFVFKILFHIAFVITVLLMVASPILLGNASQINSMLGIETQIGQGAVEGNLYYNTKFKNMAEVKQASIDIIEEAEAEGAVLLKNEDIGGKPALPINKDEKVTLYGAASYYSVHTGQGSGGVEGGALNDRVTLYDGLTEAGLTVNADLNTWYKDNANSSSVFGTSGTNFIGASAQTTQFIVKDLAWDSLDASKNNETDVAIMVLGRNSGEALDLYMNVTMQGGQDDGMNVILGRSGSGKYTTDYGDSGSLAENEADVLRNLKAMKDAGTISKIVVLMNTANPMQCEFLDNAEYGVDACMWVGNMGTSGASAVGKLLAGEYNPSGRTVNTFWRDNSYNPVYYNFGSIEYGNSGILESYFSTDGFMNNDYYVAYQEGIYNGYKYTETRYEDYVTGRPNTGTFNYDDAVSYPFGYGLSYSDFTYSNMKVTENKTDDTYTVTVDVTNNSSIDGKEAVQVYAQKAYTEKDEENGVEKAAVELVGFDKVDVPARGTVTAEIVVKGKYLAAYDSNVEKTYVIGSSDTSDKYLLTVAKDAHDATNNILRYKAANGVSVDTTKMTFSADRGQGDSALVWSKYFAYDNKTYSTNAYIESNNENFTPDYEGQEANFGVDKITNQFDDVDYTKAGIFSEAEESQPYLTRSDWEGTYGIRVDLTATDALVQAQKNPAVQTDDIPYPTYGEQGFYESLDTFDEMKLIYLRGKDIDDPDWDILLDQITWEDTCAILQDALRLTHGADSISAPSTSQQNGGCAPNHPRTYSDFPSQSGFRGFAEMLDPDNVSQKPAVFLNNGLVAATYNTDLMMRYGEQTGEEGIWAGYNGIYGLGINIHRGSYGGRAFEYYSEDGFMTGMAAGYEAVGLHKLGVFVIAKHATLNDQETHRAGLNVWANEQSIREIYCRAVEVMVEIDREYTPNTLVGMMTGMNRIGAKWNGGQGFYNTVLKAEFGMQGYAISDYNSSRPYMSPIQGVLNGCDLPDGNPAGNKNGYDYNGNDIRFASYEEGYGELAWAMRTSVKYVLYTVVNSNAMNGITGDTSFRTITPAWEIAMSVLPRVALTIMIWCAVIYLGTFVYNAIVSRKKKNTL